MIELEWNYDSATQKTYIYVSAFKELNDSEKSIIKNNIREAVKLLDGTFEIV